MWSSRAAPRRTRCTPSTPAAESASFLPRFPRAQDIALDALDAGASRGAKTSALRKLENALGEIGLEPITIYSQNKLAAESYA